MNLRIIEIRNPHTFWRYVGFLKTDKTLIAIVPRPIDENYKGVTLTRDALARYFAGENSRAPRQEPVQDLVWRDGRVFHELDAGTTLLRAFLETGPYRASFNRAARNGKVNWQRTLRGMPLHAGNGILYKEVWSDRKAQQPNEVTRILLGILKKLLDDYPILPQPYGLADAIVEYGSYDYATIDSRRSVFISLLRAERSRTFRTDQIAVLEVALAFLSSRNAFRGQHAFFLYGTRAFAFVWEDACREALGGDDRALRETLAMPKWRWKSGATFFGDGQRPDIIQRLGKMVLVVDAKYYFPVPPRTTPWQDIAKQLVYARSLELNADQCLRNIFLFPSNRTIPERLGEVTVENSQNHVGSIELWSLDASIVLRRYSDHLGLDSNFIEILLA